MELGASHVPLSVLSQDVTGFQAHSIVQMDVLQVIEELIARQVHLAIWLLCKEILKFILLTIQRLYKDTKMKIVH